MIFETNVLLTKTMNFFKLFPLLQGPGRAHMGPYGSIWIRKSQKIRKKLAFMGAFKVPCTLP